MKLDVNKTPPCDVKLAPVGPCLNIPRGTTKVLTVNLQEVPLGNGWVIMTICDASLKKVMELKLVKQGLNQITFNDAFTSKLKSNQIYYYDLMLFMDTTHRKQLISPSGIWVSETIGGK